ncbi:hypothetical protein QFZ77_007560 [Paenibacillus sp. V4I3]|uniref:DUF3221 domain-containing protein n=1 Tax=Paenibacillus sp. V4I3 TaxID=3042305 RepID=UPI00277E3C7F|nr:DUF3221 domain-containing protein [Paenibacillus sp. V4I3]MDQ0878901.1 hypothetical protein [Paenibacillus sp. V4I3]
MKKLIKWILPLVLVSIITSCDRNADISENTTSPNMTGKITAIDTEGRRFLVVSPDKFLDQAKKMPDATWFSILDNVDIEYKGKTFKAEDVKIGSTVKVWSEGNMKTSYPGQTGGIRFEITAIDPGKGDAMGRVTGIEKTGEGLNENWYVNVDGVKYSLFIFTQVWKKGNLLNVTSIKVGDQIKIWFAGYDFEGFEKFVTQVVIS